MPDKRDYYEDLPRNQRLLVEENLGFIIKKEAKTAVKRGVGSILGKILG